VVDHDGEQLGIMPIEEALAVAEDQDLDLVEVAPNSDPPVCRIMDFGRFKYQQSKRSQEAKKRQKIIHVKEVKMRPKTEAHDFEFKAKHIRRFLDEGNKAKVTIMFRGREMAHQHLGMRLLTRMIEELKDVAQVEQEPIQEGRNMIMVLAPASTKNN
jgi:translation initiation factor IF-3